MNVSVDTIVTMPNVAGIRNVGNTCYLAASLQAMASSPILVQHVTALADTMKRSQRAKKRSKHELFLAGQVAAGLRAVYKFLVTGPEEAEVHHASLVATAAEGQLTQQLAALLTALQPQHSSSSAAVDPSGLLSALAWYTPEGVLQQGSQHDTAEAFEAVMDAVITEWTCWHQLHSSSSISSSSSSQQAAAAGLKQLTQPTEARNVIYQPDPPRDQLQQQLFVLDRSQREQLLHGDIWHQQGSHPCARCNDTGSNVGNMTCHHDATQQQQQQDCSALQERLVEEEEEQQQQCVSFPRLPVIGHTVDLITCCSCGYRFPRSLTPFVSLSLALPVTRSPSGSLSVPWGVDLQYCLSGYSQTEVVEGVECLKCSLRASLAAAAPAATMAVEGDAVSNSGFTPAVGRSSCHQSGCCVLQQERHDVVQLQSDTGSDACGILCAGHGLDGACYDCQQQNSHHQQELKKKQQRLLSQLTSLSTLTTPLPPLDYQQLLQQSGLAWLSCRRDVVKASRLAKTPRVLVIQLQRSVHTAAGMEKVQGHVKFPMQLDLMEYLLMEQQQQQDGQQSEHEKVQPQDQEQQQELEASGLHQKQPHMCETQHKHVVQLQHAATSAVNKIQQKLAATSSSTPAAPLVSSCTAVVQHLGAGQASGHYIMYRKANRWVGCTRALQPSVGDHEGSVNGLAAADCSSGSNSNRVSHCWLRVNDSTVCPADEQEVLQCHATLLVYERCA